MFFSASAQETVTVKKIFLRTIQAELPGYPHFSSSKVALFPPHPNLGPNLPNTNHHPPPFITSPPLHGPTSSTIHLFRSDYQTSSFPPPFVPPPPPSFPPPFFSSYSSTSSIQFGRQPCMGAGSKPADPNATGGGPGRTSPTAKVPHRTGKRNHPLPRYRS